jgi:hypothetical protein
MCTGGAVHYWGLFGDDSYFLLLGASLADRLLQIGQRLHVEQRAYVRDREVIKPKRLVHTERLQKGLVKESDRSHGRCIPDG